MSGRQAARDVGHRPFACAAWLLVAVLATGSVGCAASSCERSASGEATPAAPGPEPPNERSTAEMSDTTQAPSIGSATMGGDGTIVLQLRAETGGTIGDAQFVYAPDHPQYQQILDHLGGLAPGESKPVPPWD